MRQKALPRLFLIVSLLLAHAFAQAQTLPNPIVLEKNISVHSRALEIFWTPAPSEELDHYAVYVSNASITDVSRMTPAVNTTVPYALVAGLEENATCHVAVVAVNKNGQFDPKVTSVRTTLAPNYLFRDEFDATGTSAAYWNHSYDNARWVEADFENSTLNVRRIAPAGGGWNKSIYEKELPDAHIVNVEGKIYWKDETEKRNVSSICLIFLDQDRKEINRIGYYDTWDSHSGSKWYTGAGVQHDSLPLSGEAHIRVSRLGGRLQTYWNGKQIFEWAETRQPRYIRIETAAYNGHVFGGVGIDYIRVEGVPQATLRVESRENAARISWPGLFTSEARGYHLYLGNSTKPIFLAPETLSYDCELKNQPSTQVTIAVLSQNGTEGERHTTNVARLLPNPVPGTEEVTAFSRALSLVWQPSQPAHLVSRYNVYISGDPITDVTNLTPAGSTKEARFTRYDLEPGRTWHVAVAAVNINGHLNPKVTSVRTTLAPNYLFRDEFDATGTSAAYWNHSYDNARWVEADFENSTLNVRRIAPAGGGWNKSIYEKELPDAHIVNVEGKIYWKDETEKRNVSSICLIFLDQDRKEINRIGYYDTWDSHSGSKWYTGAGVQHDSLPLSGEAHIRVSRLGDRLQTYWNGEQIFEWAETRQPRYIRIEAAAYNGHVFGGVGVDYIRVEGVPRFMGLEPPAVTGTRLMGKPVAVRPGSNLSDVPFVTLTGACLPGAQVWAGGQLMGKTSETTWAGNATLDSGQNQLGIWQIRNFDMSPMLYVDVFADFTAPGVSSFSPENAARINVRPEHIQALVRDISELDLRASSLALSLDGTSIPGRTGWNATTSVLSFTPQAPLKDGRYQVNATVQDSLGHKAQYSSVFSLDTEPPAAPKAEAYPKVVHHPQFTFRGTKNAGDLLFFENMPSGDSSGGNMTLDDQIADTTWEHTVRLAPGNNTFSVRQQDDHENVSEALILDIRYEDGPPVPLTNATAESLASGTSLLFSWNYDESASGDIKGYHVYLELTPISALRGLTPRKTVPAGVFNATIDGLKRGVTYHWAVSPVDTAGQTAARFASGAVKTLDSEPPADITGLNVEQIPGGFILTWPKLEADDLYRIHVHMNGREIAVLPGNATRYEVKGLDPDTNVQFSLRLEDISGNMSPGLVHNATTMLARPTVLGGEVFSGLVREGVLNAASSTTVNLNGTAPGERVIISGAGLALNANATIRRVGPARQYTSIQAAVDAAKDGDVIYIDKGDYPGALNIHKWVSIIGLGEYPEDVTIRDNPGNVYAIDFRTSTLFNNQIYIENIEIRKDHNTNHGSGIISFVGSSGNGSICFNKCKLIGNNITVILGHMLNGYTTKAIFKNSLFYGNSNFYYNCVTENFSYSKIFSETTDTPFSDYVTQPTPGYGPGYGQRVGFSAEGPVVNGRWALPVTLPQGNSTLEVHAVNGAGNRSPSVPLSFYVDSLAPEIVASTPANGTAVSAASSIVLTLDEATALDTNASSIVLESGNWTIPCSWSVNASELTIRPSFALTDGSYRLKATLADTFENLASNTLEFSIDSTHPSPPVVVPLPSPVTQQRVTVTGTKGPGEAILLNGREAVPHTPSTEWSVEVELAEGLNTLSFTARNRAGNISEPTRLDLVYDNVAPAPITTLRAVPQASGTDIIISWTYPEPLDFKEYRIFVSTKAFEDIAGLTPREILGPGSESFKISGLERNITYYLAVVPVDTSGHFISRVTPVTARTKDTLSPGPIRPGQVQSRADSLTFTWLPPENDSPGRYQITAAGKKPVWITEPSFTLTGLSREDVGKITVLPEDADGNVGAQPVTLTGHTWLRNPGNPAIAAQGDGWVQLAWKPVYKPYLSHYNVYTTTNASIAEVPGGADTRLMTLAGRASSESLKVAVENGRDTYLAVTAVNKSGGEDPVSRTVSARTAADTTGPEIAVTAASGGTATELDAVPLTVSRPVTFTVRATDPSGVKLVEFMVNGLVRARQTSSFSWTLYPAELTDGNHTLTIRAHDLKDNTASRGFTLTVGLTAPGRPVITLPAPGTVTNNPRVVVTGRAGPLEMVHLAVDGTRQTSVSANVNGLFSGTVTLTNINSTGVHHITAKAENRAGQSQDSLPVSVILDESAPAPPVGLSALPRPEGRIFVSWNQAQGARYELYRAASSFESPAGATRIHTGTGTSFTDMPPVDGTYFYRIRLMNSSGNWSPLSEPVRALSDRVPPRALQIRYSAEKAEGGRVGQGVLSVEVDVDETLSAPPFLSLTVSGEAPMLFALEPLNATRWTGRITLPAGLIGMAQPVFAAYDGAGNVGADIVDHAPCFIDTAGPALTDILTSPAAPIHNPGHAQIRVTFVLDEAPAATPRFRYRLNQASGPVENLVSDTGRTTWHGWLRLPPAGPAGALSFEFEAEDNLGNNATRITAANAFEIYSGNLPPLPAPGNLRATPGPGGLVRLEWAPVPGACGYRIARRSAGTDFVEINATTDTNTTDIPPLDVPYIYGVSSVRCVNGEEAVSSRNTVQILPDRVAPPAPSELVGQVAANGIYLRWTAPANATDVAMYRIYRGLEADPAKARDILSRIPVTHTVDTTPSLTEHYYWVVSVDAAGNESPVSNEVYVSPRLLPVQNLAVSRLDDAPPVLTWTHPAPDLEGFNCTLSTFGVETNLHDGLLAESNFTDSRAGRGERRYLLRAVDRQGAASLGREVVLPDVELAFPENQLLRRGVMNELTFVVANRGNNETMPGARLILDMAGGRLMSGVFSLDAGAQRAVGVIVPGLETLNATQSFTLTLEYPRVSRETVRVSRSLSVSVEDGSLGLRLTPESFTRGGFGTARFELTNGGKAAMDLVTAGPGGSPSPEISLILEDKLGNVLARTPLTQTSGDMIQVAADGRFIARIPAGRTFVSAPMTLSVPVLVPDNLVARLVISHLHARLGLPEAVSLKGMQGEVPVRLVETPYVGELTSISPERVVPGKAVLITGRAVDRSGQPLAGARLNLIVESRGVERLLPVVTGTDGVFTQAVTTRENDAGEYAVRVMHPDQSVKPVHGRFWVERLSVDYNRFRLQILHGQERNITIRATAAPGTVLSDLRLERAPEDPLPQGLTITPAPPVAVPSGGQAAVSMTIAADRTAPETVTLLYHLVSGQGASRRVWHDIRLDIQCAEGRPALFYAPTHVATAMNPGGEAGERLVITNRGFAPVELTIRKVSGPEWVRLRSSEDLGFIEPGQSRDVLFALNPPAATPTGQYDTRFEVRGGGLAAQYQVFVTLSASGRGDASFKIIDVLTGTADEQGRIRPGVPGASITLTHEESAAKVNAVTDAGGNARLENLPVGPYQYRVRKAGHKEGTGRIWIRPGSLAYTDVFLDSSLVTVEWEVREITIEDRYEIILNPIFNTSVTEVARIVVSPMSLTLPPMRAGQEMNGEVTLTNQGDLGAQKFVLSMPGENRYFRYELLGEVPENLGPRQTVTLPYRVTCLKDFAPDDCVRLQAQAGVRYMFLCVNGHESWQATGWVWYANHGLCQAPPSGPGEYSGGGGGDHGGGGPGGGPVIVAPAPAPQPMGGKCLPEPPACEHGNCPRPDTEDGPGPQRAPRPEFDLGEVRLGPNLSAAPAPWPRTEPPALAPAHDSDRLVPEPGALRRDGVEYRKTSVNADTWVNGPYVIKKTDQGYLWTGLRGRFRHYDADGRLTAEGGRLGVNRSWKRDTDGRVTQVLDSANRTLAELKYAGESVSITDRAGNVSKIVYKSGQVERIVTPQGETGFAYVRDRLASVAYPSGLAVSYACDDYGYLRLEKDNAGLHRVFDYNYDFTRKLFYTSIREGSRTDEYWYNSQGEMVRHNVNGKTEKAVHIEGMVHTVTDAAGEKTVKEYDNAWNLLRVIHPDNSEEKSEYNAFGQPVRRVDPAGTVTAYAYDASGNLLKMTEAQGTNLERNSTFTYDARGNQLTATRGRAVTRMEYDEWDNPVRQVDAAGVETRFTYDALGRELTRTRAGAVWKREYGTDGRVANSTDPLGAVTRFFYDAGGNPVKTVDPTGNATEAGYDPAGRMMNATDALGGVTRFTYDSQGRLASRTDAAGQRMEYAYTPRGDLARTQDPAGTVSMTYDAPGKGCSSCGGSAAGRPVRVDYPTFSRLFAYDGLGRTVRETDVFGPKNETRGVNYVYDRAGRLAEKREWAHDPDLTHRVTKYAYDQLGRLVRETDNLGQATNYGYDAWDNLLALTDAKGQVTRFAHDAAGRTVSETRPLGGTTRYTYNATTGLLAEKLDARGVKTAYAYDLLGRVVGVDAYAGGRTEPGRKVRLAYDQMGRLVFHTDGQTAGACTYDALGRKLTETVDYGSFNKTNTYAWQANGQPAAFTGPDGLARTYAYDTAGRLTAMSVGAGMVTLDDFTWTAPGTMTLPGGTRRRIGYDGLMRVTAINATSPADALIQNYSYTYDDAGNIRKKDTEHGAYAYSYDKLDRLIRSDNPVLTDEAFTYDQVGNRLSSADVSGGWLYNGNNELLQAGNRAEYRYDAAGNLIEKKTAGKTLAFSYDLDNRLSEIHADGVLIARYVYDPFGRRIWKEVRGSRTYFHYSDSGLVAEMDSNGNTLKSYGYRPGSPWGTDPLFMRENGKSYWYLNDHLGTPQMVVAENGGVVWKAQYQVFGKAEIDGGSTLTNNLRFPGQYFDEETGLHYNWNRYYDPESGRYSQTDPIGLRGGINLYGYTQNNSLNFIDPEGEHPVLLLIGAGVTVLLLPDIANAPDTCDETYPSMSDGEFIVNAAILESIGFFSGKLIGTIFSKLSLLKEKLSIKILGNSNNFDMLKKGIDLDILSNSGKLADKGGLTRAGRAAQKHGSRHESAFPPQKGNLRTINQRGQDILDDILTDPNGYIVRRHHVKYGDIIEIRDSLGRGARFDSNGNFMGFLEP